MKHNTSKILEFKSTREPVKVLGIFLVIPNYYLSEYGGLQFLLKCNYNAESINKCLPNFYRELLQYFQEFKNKTNIFPYGEFLLWNKMKRVDGGYKLIEFFSAG